VVEHRFEKPWVTSSNLVSDNKNCAIYSAAAGKSLKGKSLKGKPFLPKYLKKVGKKNTDAAQLSYPLFYALIIFYISVSVVYFFVYIIYIYIYIFYPFNKLINSTSSVERNL
jgi:hypothetical protein